MRGLALALLAWLALGALAQAVEPGEILPDPSLEARARAISSELRCLVCQNQSIDDSQAQLAKDLRVLVRERLVAGDSDANVRSYLVARYGDFILLKPPVKPETLLLWATPFGILVVAGITLAFRSRRPGPPAAPLTPNEEQDVARLLRNEQG